MRLLVLGPIEVSGDDGDSAPIGAPREQMLTVALALAAPEAMSVGHLIDVLWGDDPPSSAAATLKSLVHRIRRRHGSEMIATVAGGYRLGPVNTDVAEVRSLIEPWTGGGSVEETVLRCEQAVSAFRGPPSPALGSTVAGVALAREIEALRSRAVDARLDARLDAGGGGELVGELEAAVEAEPLDERSWERLMIALFRAGRQAAALGAFQRARKALVEGAGVEPGPGLRDLERRIIEQDTSLLRGSLAAPSSEPEAVPGRFASDLAWADLSAPLVGRDAEIAAVADRLADARRGSGRHLVLIEGSAGIGKTSLAAHTAAHAAENGDLVLYGRCDQNSSAPYRPFSSAFGRLLDINEPGPVESSLGADTSLISRVVPSLRDRFVAEDQRTDADEVELRSHDAMSRWIERLGATAPVVVVLDDLHWATHHTVDLLTHLLDDPRSGLTIIGTYRSSDVGVGHPFGAVLPTLSRRSLTAIVGLPRFEHSDVGTYVEAVTGQTPRPEVVETILSATGGVPYLISSSLEYLTSESGATRQGGRWLLEPASVKALPVGVRHLIEARTSRLDPAALAVLRTASVSGPTFDVEVIADAAGCTSAEAVEAMEAAEMVGLVRERGYGRWMWDHDLARMIVLGGLSTTRRVQTHWRLASAMGHRTEADLDDVAFHAIEGMLAGPPPEVASLLLTAAEDALDRSPANSLTYATSGLEALGRAPDPDPVTEAGLLTVRAIAYFETSSDPDAADVVAAMREAERASLESGDPDWIVRSHTLEGRYPGPRQFFQFDARRVEAGLAALSRLNEASTDHRALLLAHLVELHFYNWDAPTSSQVVNGLLETIDEEDLSASAAGRVRGTLAAFNAVGFGGTKIGLRDRIRAGRSGIRHSSPAAVDSRDAIEHVDTVLDMHDLESAVTAGAFSDAARTFERLDPSAGSLSVNDQISLMRLRCILASALGDQEGLETAAHWFGELKPRPRLFRFVEELRREVLCCLTLVSGVSHGGAEAFERALADPLMTPPYRIVYQLAVCWELLLRGEIGRCEEMFRSLDDRWFAGRGALALPAVVGALAADAVALFGSPEERAAVQELLAPLVGTWTIGPVFCIGPVDLSLGVVERALGMGASERFGAAAEMARKSGSSWWEDRVSQVAG